MRSEPEQQALFTIDRTLLRVAREAFGPYNRAVHINRAHHVNWHLVVFEDGTWITDDARALPMQKKPMRVSLRAVHLYDSAHDLAFALAARDSLVSAWVQNGG